MKAILLATSAVAVLFAVPAAAQTVGSVGVSYIDSKADLAGFDADSNGAAVNLSAATVFGEWTVGYGANLAWTKNDDLGDDSTLSGSVHVNRLFGEGLRAGGFVGAVDTDETLWTVGAEVQKYIAAATFTGVASYSSIDDVDADLWSIGGEAAYYPMSNVRLAANGSWNTVDADGFDTDAYTLGASAEYQIPSTQLSVYGAYDRTSLEDFDLDIDTFQVGVRFGFGGGLQARDQAGANLARSIGGVASALGYGAR